MIGSTTRRQALLVLLAFTSGALDAIGLLSLGGAFTSVMTGNMILLGSSAALGHSGVALRSALAIVLFMAGAFAGARLAGRPQPEDPVWPPQVSRALSIELLLLAGFGAGWWLTGSQPSSAMQVVLLGVAAVALGLQSSAIVRFGVSGLSTTYMTGTLTTLVTTLAHGQHPRNVVPSALILAGLIAGAAVAAVLAVHVEVLVPLVALVPLGVVVVLGRVGARAA